MKDSNPNRPTGTALVLVIFLTSMGCMTTASGQPCFTNFTLLGANPKMTIMGEVGTTNQILCITDLSQSNWTVVTNVLVTQNPYTFVDTSTMPGPQRFYRVVDPNWPANSIPGMALIPAGSFQMGDTFDEGEYYELPVHAVYVSAFYMDKYEATLALWDAVEAWSATNGYSYDYPGFGKATNHPVLNIDWYDMVKWCNARSQMEGRVPSYYTDAALTQVYTNGQVAPFVNWNAGYRLPTESEWEKAARGGVNGHRFPWSDVDTISESQANYYCDTNDYSYDIGPTPGYNPAFIDQDTPYTSPVGSFAPNGYGLYDMAGNAWEWCWDYAGTYPSNFQTDPHGPATDQGSGRVGRGGNWNYYATDCRNSYRYGNSPTYSASNIGFRCALSAP
jgi:formylglycine-generating enzyme required for sulfatase activity